MGYSEKSLTDWFYKAAKQNDAIGQFAIGICHYIGFSVSQNYSEAVYWFSKAADQNDIIAKYYLANCYSEGKGVKRSWIEAHTLRKEIKEIVKSSKPEQSHPLWLFEDDLYFCERKVSVT